MRWRTCLVLLGIGLGILICGFVYDVLLAGIPYQDPTPAMQASYVYHSRNARAIEAAVLMIWALGVINAALSWVHVRVSRDRHSEKAPMAIQSKGK